MLFVARLCAVLSVKLTGHGPAFPDNTFCGRQSCRPAHLTYCNLSALSTSFRLLARASCFLTAEDVVFYKPWCVLLLVTLATSGSPTHTLTLHLSPHAHKLLHNGRMMVQSPSAKRAAATVMVRNKDNHGFDAYVFVLIDSSLAWFLVCPIHRR